MIRPTGWNEDGTTDNVLPKIIGSIKSMCAHHDDDFILLVAGETGVGKSTIGLHCGKQYLEGDEYWRKDHVAFSRSDFAQSIDYARKQPLNRLVMYDEANINRREGLTKWNRAVIDLLFAIRGLNTFFILCNPSANILDRELVKERIKGMILITTKDKNRPRVYYYFTKKDLLRVLQKYDTLDIGLLRRVKGEYAYSAGFFRQYGDSFIKQYNVKKLSRMHDKVGDFVEQFGGNGLSMMESAKKIGVSAMTVHDFVKKKLVVEGEDYKYNPLNGRYSFTEEAIEKIRNIMMQRHNKREAKRIEAPL